MRSFVYESSSGEVIDLCCDGLRVGQIMDLRSREWDATLGFRSVSNVNSPSRDAELNALSTNLTMLDRARMVMDSDVRRNSPGKLIINGLWSQRALILKSVSSMVTPVIQKIVLTARLLDGGWRHGVAMSFMASVANSGEFLNYPHPYPYDYSLTDSGSGSIENTQLQPAPLSLTFWGPVANPAVTIGANRYACDITVDTGSRLEIDGIAKTITLIDQQGNKSNAFGTGRRGNGEGRGEYIFEPVPAGPQRVSWSGGFGFDLTLYEEGMEPPWSTLS